MRWLLGLFLAATAFTLFGLTRCEAAQATVRSDLKPSDIQFMLSSSGLNIGTCRQLAGKGVYCVGGLKFTAKGPWIIISILPTRPR
jgi:hypothetical protein